MLTNIINGSREINKAINLFESNFFKYAYTDQLFSELGVNITSINPPIRGDDSWFVLGDLHGLKVLACYNSYENLNLYINDKKIKFQKSIGNTLSKFISVFRETWKESFSSSQDLFE